MATEDSDDAAGGLGTQTETDTPAPAGGAALPRLSLDDLRLRLDSPLFARDPGLATPVQVPRLKELTWEHVVNPASRQAAAADAEALAAGVDSPLAGPPPADPAAATLIADDAPPAGAARISPTALPPRPTIEELLSDRRPAATVEPPAPAPGASAAAPAEPVRQVETPIDEALLQIVEPPPAQRAADPVLHDLADLIVRATPPAGQPIVSSTPTPVPEPVAVEPQPVAVEPQPVAVEPQPVAVAPEPVAVAPEPVAVEPQPVAVVPQPVAVVPQPESAPPARVDVTTVQPAVATPGSAVEAELNRLAFLPDQEDEAGPIEVPSIAVADPPAATATPLPSSLTLAQSDVYAPRSSAGPVNRRSYADIVAEAQPFVPPSRRRKRHLFRNLVTMLVILGIVAGGLYALKYYVLDPRWSGDVKPLASDVEGQRGLTFDHAVKVSTLPADEYAVQLAERALGLDADSTQQVAGEWRALGLLNGVNDARAIGMAALADSPAFYDPKGETIYVVADLPVELRAFALHRALTMALLDQTFGWGDRVAGASPAVARGTRALYEADALETAQAILTPETRTAVTAQIFGLYSTYDIPTTPSPFATVVSGRLGVALWPYFRGLDATQREAVERDATIVDGTVLDLRRLTSGATEQVPADSQGMLFWYHVLAARIDDDLAWRAALSWHSDRLVSTTDGGRQCVSGVFGASGDGSDLVGRAFQQWAAGAPAQAPASVAVADVPNGVEVTVTACDPGPSVPTNDGGQRLSLGGAPLRAEQFRLLLEQQPGLADAVAACAVYGGDPVSMSDERGTIDGPDGWSAPAAHPAPDPASSGCS